MNKPLDSNQTSSEEGDFLQNPSEEREIKIVDITGMGDDEINKILKRMFGNNVKRVWLGDYYPSMKSPWINGSVEHIDYEQCVENGYFYYDSQCFSIPSKDVLLLLVSVEKTDDERVYYSYDAVIRSDDLASYGVEIKEEDDKKIITKKYENGKIVIEANEDDLVTKMKAESDEIEIEAHFEDSADVVTVTKHYSDGTVETFTYTFTPGSPNYEDPWYLNDVEYYNDYLKKTSIMPLIKDILDRIKDMLENIVKYED